MFIQTSACSAVRPFRRVCLVIFIAIWGATACASYRPSFDDNWMAPTDSVESLPPKATISDLVAYAYTNNPRIRSAYEAIEGAHAQIIAAGAFADPQLSVSQGLSDSSWQTIAIEQEIPLFQRRQIAISQAELALEVRRADYSATRNDVRAQVHIAAAEYLYVQQRIRLQQDVLAIMRQSMAAAQSRYESGQVPMAEFLRAQNAYDHAQIDAANFETLQQSAQSRLNSALGRDARAPLPDLPELQASHAAYAALPAPEDTLYESLETNNPALLASRFAVYQQQAAQDLAARAGRPAHSCLCAATHRSASGGVRRATAWLL
ncbi:MAG: TolC family protein [Firmicutes bacterium]|nr:TolC family protein [Bacillota bacterium]